MLAANGIACHGADVAASACRPGRCVAKPRGALGAKSMALLRVRTSDKLPLTQWATVSFSFRSPFSWQWQAEHPCS